MDNVAENFSLQQQNGIFIRTWIEDLSDTALIDLAPLLKRKYLPFYLIFVIFHAEIVEKKEPDVTEALRKYRDQMLAA